MLTRIRDDERGVAMVVAVMVVFVVMLELAAIAVVGVEYALAKIVEQVRGTAGARRASVRS